MLPSKQNAFFNSSPMMLTGGSGMWFSPDEVNGVGFKSAQTVTDNYQIVLPPDLPAVPNNYFLGLNTIVGTDVFTNWLPASGKIPWSVAVPGSAYESISEYTSLSTAFNDAQLTGEHVSVLVLPGQHDAQPNVVLPLNVDLIGWGANVSIIDGEVQIAGPFSQPLLTWHIREVDVRNTGKGNVALRITNNGTPIGANGLIYVDNSAFNGNITISNDDGGNMSFQVCRFDSSEVCFTGSQGGSISLFDCVVLTISGGQVCDIDAQRFLVNWSGIFNVPTTTSMFCRNDAELRFLNSFINIDDIHSIDSDFVMSSTFLAPGTQLFLETLTGVAGSAKINASKFDTLQTNGSYPTEIYDCVANTITSSDGFNLLIDNSRINQMALVGNVSSSQNILNFKNSSCLNYLTVNGRIDTSSIILNSQTLTNVNIQVEAPSSLYFYQSYMNTVNVNSSTTTMDLQFFQNSVQGNGPLFGLNMNGTDTPLFIQNVFNVTSNLALADAPGTTIFSQNNISSPSSFWNATTSVPNWIEL